MEEPRADSPQEENVPKFRGLYRHVKISVRALDWTIGVCIAVILIVLAIEMFSPGLKVTFDPRGGTDVEAMEQQYGQLLELPAPPTREGYTFTGWYKDFACEIPWDAETDTIENDMTVYAGWEKNE